MPEFAFGRLCGHPRPFPRIAPRRLAAALLCLLLVLGIMPGRASGQFEVGGGTGEITITAPWFGVGGVVRPGEYAGIRLALTDIGDRQREVLVRITLPDPDGDRILYERVLTTNPGITQPLWMYVRLPSRFRQGEGLSVTAFAAIEQAGPGSAAEGRWMYTAGRVLGTARITPRTTVPSTTGMLGIVGSRSMGLMRYAGAPRLEYHPTGHERTEVVQRLDPDILPDRWFGLAQFHTLVWNEPSPAALGTERAEALREWVMRGGGHLVVVLPRLGQMWTDEANNPLYDLMPRASIRRIEGVDLGPYAPLITRSTEMAMPRQEILHAFTPLEGALSHEAVCVLAGPPGPEGDPGPCIAVRRVVGTGMVTVVGLDVASRWMTERGLPEADLFWHRLLGRRGELSTPTDDLTSPINLSREPITLDRDIPDQIAKTGRAAAGVLIGFVVFIAYWLVAGPVGYALLKHKGLARHGWMAFVAAAGVFTAIAWGGATAIKPQQIEAAHLTYLDHVYGQPVQRTRTWVSLLVPEYGEATVMLDDPLTRANSRFHNIVAPWEPDGQSAAGFPDARDYRIESRAPDQVTVPVRATVKQFQMDWAGGPRWRMPRPVGDASEHEPRVQLVRQGNDWQVHGTLVHELPDTMRNVTFILITGQRDFARSLHAPGSRALLSHVFAVARPAWEPGTPLDLATDIFPDLTPQPRNPAYGGDVFRQLLENIGRPDSQEGLDYDATHAVRRLTAAALFSQLEPPDTRVDTRIGQSQRLAQRKNSHNWDLGMWFTQPALIIIGHVGDGGDGAPSPTPIHVSMQGGLGAVAGGGQFREVPTYGRTVVRWVYPLESDPPRFPVRTPEDH